MSDFTTFDTEMNLANQKSGVADGNVNASVECLKHLLDAVQELGKLVKEIDKKVS